MTVLYTLQKLICLVVKLFEYNEQSIYMLIMLCDVRYDATTSIHAS